MYPDRHIRPEPAMASQRGAGLPMAIFLITVMALIVATIVQLQESTGEMEALDVLSARAFYAAESGAQVALSQALEGEDAACGPVSEGELAFEESGLQGCVSSIGCEASGSAILISSEGRCGSGQAQAERIIEVKAQ